MKLRATNVMCLALFFTLISVSFQNCGQSGFGNSEDLQTLHFSTIGMKAPFAFDTKVDQITYMSCFAGSAPTDSSFFTLKVGAFGSTGPNSGVKLRPEFLAYAKSQIKPVYPNTEITVPQLTQVLTESPQNVMAIPRIGLRNRFNIHSTIVNLDNVNVLGNLSSENYMATYVSNDMLSTSAPNSSSFFQYFPLAPGNLEGQRRLDGTLKFDLKDTGESLSAQIRKNLSDNPNNPDSAIILALTYPPYPGDETQARAPASSSTKPDNKIAYGSGFDLKFSQETSRNTPHAQNPQNVLSSVNEFDLEKSSRPPISGWNCSRRYKIYRNTDVGSNSALCPSFDEHFPRQGDTPEIQAYRKTWRKELEIAYNQLDPSAWEINPLYSCAYPKSPNISCYNENQRKPDGTFVGVEYNNSQPCLRAVDDTGLNSMFYQGTPPTALCAQYISICVRNN